MFHPAVCFFVAVVTLSATWGTVRVFFVSVGSGYAVCVVCRGGEAVSLKFSSVLMLPVPFSAASPFSYPYRTVVVVAVLVVLPLTVNK